jgi:excisionase family DNA binding protein
VGKRTGPKIHVWFDRTIPGHVKQRVDDPTMTLTEVANYLNVHPLTIYRAIKAGARLGQFRMGRVWRFNREDLEQFANLGRMNS